MFTGSYTGNIDDKGRVVIPMKLRLSLGERICICKGVDGCLNVFTQDAWNEYKDSYISNRTHEDEKARRLHRLVFGGAQELEIDRQGRINLPLELKEFAKIKKDVTVIGCGNFIEIWSAEAYRKEAEAINGEMQALMSNAAKITAAASVD